MRCLCLPLLLLAVLFQVGTGLSAEPPAKCKLKLVRLQPVMSGKPWPEDEQFVRFARSLYFRQDMENNVLDKGSQKAEKDFRAIVKKEPKEYNAQHPLRAVLVLAGNKYALVLDKQSKKSLGYDRLYFDLNGNGDLTDDVPIDVPDAYKTAESVTSDKGWISTEYPFPRVDLKIHAEGREWDYSFFLISNTTTHDKKEVFIQARLIPAAYRQGDITLQGKKRQIILVDWNVSGRFDVPVSFASDGKGVEEFLGTYGTDIVFDKDVLLEKHLSYMSEHRQFLAKMNALGGRFYNIKVTPGGDELTCTSVAVPMGRIALPPQMQCNVWLISEQGLLALDLQNDTPVNVPVGKWRLLNYTLWRFDDKGHKTAQAGATNKSGANVATSKSSVVKSPDIIYLNTSDTRPCDPIIVVANQTTTLKIGPPFTPTLAVERKGEVAMLGLEVRGIGHEKVDCHDTQGKQKLRITDPQGKIVEQGSFEYG